MKNLAGDGKHLNKPLQLELYRSENFIGYFVKDDDENVLKRLALNFVKEVSDSSKIHTSFVNYFRWRTFLSLIYLTKFPTVVSDSIDLDNLIACFPYCASVNEKTKSSRCIPKSSRCKQTPCIVDLLYLVHVLLVSLVLFEEVRLWFRNGLDCYRFIDSKSKQGF